MESSEPSRNCSTSRSARSGFQEIALGIQGPNVRYENCTPAELGRHRRRPALAALPGVPAIAEHGVRAHDFPIRHGMFAARGIAEQVIRAR